MSTQLFLSFFRFLLKKKIHSLCRSLIQMVASVLFCRFNEAPCVFAIAQIDWKQWMTIENAIVVNFIFLIQIDFLLSFWFWNEQRYKMKQRVRRWEPFEMWRLTAFCRRHTQHTHRISFSVVRPEWMNRAVVLANDHCRLNESVRALSRERKCKTIIWSLVLLDLLEMINIQVRTALHRVHVLNINFVSFSCCDYLCTHIHQKSMNARRKKKIYDLFSMRPFHANIIFQ